jgi:tRNA-binding EMAP/Myf-like protein
MTVADPPPTISFDDFLKVDIRLGTILSAEPFPQDPFGGALPAGA